VTEAMNRLAAIRLVAFDVDGVFTDGRFYLSDDGIETKAFNTQDGFGVRQLDRAGVTIAVISGRKSPAVEKRMAELGITHVVLGCADKVAALESIVSQLGIEPADCAFVGDDLPDMPALKFAGFSVAVANATAPVKAYCDYTTTRAGGFGAVREVCDLIVEARGGQRQ